MAVVITKNTYYVVYFLLLGLLAATIVLAYFPLGAFGTALGYSIASIKAILIILYFMHVRKASWLTWAFAGSAFLWLGILFVLTLSDYLTRGWLPSEETLTKQIAIPPPQPAREALGR